MRETPTWWIAQCQSAADEAYQAGVESVAAAPVPDLIQSLMAQPVGPGQEDIWAARRSGVVSTEASEAGRCAASFAWQAAMPAPVDRATTKAFIACVAAGLQRRYIAPLEGKTLMYSAQLALAAYRPRERK